MSLTIENLICRRGDFSLNIPFAEAPSAAITAILGANGSGKSSLLLALAGLVPSRGELFWSGAYLETDAKAAARQRVFVAAELPAPNALSVRSMVSLASLQYTPATHNIDRILSIWELEALADVPYGRLSSGQRRRVILARAFLHLESLPRPGLLLLDEPYANLDVRHQSLLTGRMREAANNGHAVIKVIHEIPWAYAADAVWCMKAGELLAFGRTAEVLQPDILKFTFSTAFADIRNSGQGMYLPETLLQLVPEQTPVERFT